MFRVTPKQARARVNTSPRMVLSPFTALHYERLQHNLQKVLNQAYALSHDVRVIPRHELMRLRRQTKAALSELEYWQERTRLEGK